MSDSFLPWFYEIVPGATPAEDIGIFVGLFGVLGAVLGTAWKLWPKKKQDDTNGTADVAKEGFKTAQESTKLAERVVDVLETQTNQTEHGEALRIASKAIEAIEEKAKLEKAGLEADLADREERIKGLTATIESLKAAPETNQNDLAVALIELQEGDTTDIESLLTQKAEKLAAQGQATLATAAETYVEIGNLADYTDTKRALSAYAKATECNPDNADAWNGLAKMQFRLGNFDVALTALEEMRSIGNQNNDKTIIAKATSNLGAIYRKRGNIDEAEKMYRQALFFYQEPDQKEGMAAQHGNLGLIYRRRGDLDEAEKMFRQSLALYEELDHKEGMASDYGNLGVIYQRRGDLDEAEEMHKKSLAIEEELGRKEGIASDHGNLGVIYGERGELNDAEKMFRKALEINVELGRKEGMANEYGNLGMIYKKRGDNDAACQHWQNAHELFVEMGMKPEIEQTLADMKEAGCPPPEETKD